MKNLTVLLVIFGCTVSSFHTIGSCDFNSELFSLLLFTSNANHLLANKRILKLEQDVRGFIWGGTGKGVFRFDGYSYEKLTAENSSVDLSVVFVRSLLADEYDHAVDSRTHNHITGTNLPLRD